MVDGLDLSLLGAGAHTVSFSSSSNCSTSLNQFTFTGVAATMSFDAVGDFTMCVDGLLTLHHFLLTLGPPPPAAPPPPPLPPQPPVPRHPLSPSLPGHPPVLPGESLEHYVKFDLKVDTRRQLTSEGEGTNPSDEGEQPVPVHINITVLREIIVGYVSELIQCVTDGMVIVSYDADTSHIVTLVEGHCDIMKPLLMPIFGDLVDLLNSRWPAEHILFHSISCPMVVIAAPPPVMALYPLPQFPSPTSHPPIQPAVLSVSMSFVTVEHNVTVENNVTIEDLDLGGMTAEPPTVSFTSSGDCADAFRSFVYAGGALTVVFDTVGSFTMCLGGVLTQHLYLVSSLPSPPPFVPSYQQSSPLSPPSPISPASFPPAPPIVPLLGAEGVSTGLSVLGAQVKDAFFITLVILVAIAAACCICCWWVGIPAWRERREKKVDPIPVTSMSPVSSSRPEVTSGRLIRAKAIATIYEAPDYKRRVARSIAIVYEAPALSWDIARTHPSDTAAREDVNVEARRLSYFEFNTCPKVGICPAYPRVAPGAPRPRTSSQGVASSARSSARKSWP